MKKTMSRVSAGVVAGLLFAAAANLASAAPADQGDGGKVRLMFSEFGSNSYPPFVIKKFELDKKHGFELQTIPAPTTQARVTLFQSKGAELATLDWVDTARMQAAGIKVIGVGPFLQFGSDFIVVPVNSPLKNLGDVKGKRFGTYSRTSLDYIVERAVSLKIYNFDLEKEAKVQEAATPLLLGLLEQGQLDATEVFNSLTPEVVVSGKGRALHKLSDLMRQLGMPEIPFLLYVCDADYLAAHPDNIRAFLAAYRDAIDILRSNDGVWIERGKQMKMSEQAAALFRTEGRKDFWREFKSDTEANIRQVFDVLFAIGGAEVLGTPRLPDAFMTLGYQ